VCRSGGQAWYCRARIPQTKKAHPAAPEQAYAARQRAGSTTSTEGGVLGADLLKALAKRWRADDSRKLLAMGVQKGRVQNAPTPRRRRRR